MKDEGEVSVTATQTKQVARDWFNALDRGDMNAAVACMANDIEWENLPKIPGDLRQILPFDVVSHAGDSGIHVPAIKRVEPVPSHLLGLCCGHAHFSLVLHVKPRDLTC